jgi:hypothetical protein
MTTSATAAGLMFSIVFNKYAPTGCPRNKYAPTGCPRPRGVGEQNAASDLNAVLGHTAFARRAKVFPIRFR